MARERFQDPTIDETSSGRRFIRPWVDVIKDGQVTRQKRRFYLEKSGEHLGQRELMKRKKAIMDTINRADYVVQSQIPFSEFADYYTKNHVEAKDNLSASTQQKYKSHLKNHIRPAFDQFMLCEVDTKRIQNWLNAKAEDGLSWSTRTDLRNILSSIFTKAIDWGHWKDRNPVERVSVGRKRLVREKRKLTDEQARSLLAMLRSDVREIICVALFLALRISEILGLQWRHIDFARGVVRIEQRFYRGDTDTTKNTKPREIPLGYLADQLALRKGSDDEYVFQVATHAGTKRESVSRDDRDINQHFLRPAAKSLGIYWKGFGFHSFRREAITEMMRHDPGQAQRFAGHSSADMTLEYTLSDQAQQERIIRARQEALLGIAGRVQ